MKFWVWVSTAFVVVIGAIAWLMHTFYTKVEPRDYITLVVGGVAAVACLQSWRSANAATKNAALAQINEDRRNYGWAVTLNGDHYELLNTGTLEAHDVTFANVDDFTDIEFEQHDGERGPDIPPGQSKAFRAFFGWGSRSSEIQIDWLPDGETERQRFNKVLPPMPNKQFDETVNRREAEKAAEAAAAERFLVETRRLLLDLAEAWGDYQADSSPRNKIRVQALVAALPGNMAKEIGYAVDVQRDLWGPQQWPLDVLVLDPKDKKLVRDNAPMIELMWNLLQVQLPEILEADNSQSPRPWYRIEDAVYGYVELVRRREKGDRELLDGPRDRKTREKAMKDLAEFSARFQEQKARPKTEGGRNPASE